MHKRSEFVGKPIIHFALVFSARDYSFTLSQFSVAVTFSFHLPGKTSFDWQSK